jgi:protein-S-isoprenylcysteine O-methyltransferase Ste14
VQLVLMASIVVVAWRASPPPIGPDPLAVVVRAVGYVALVAGIAVTLVGSHLLRRARAFSPLPRPVDSGVLVDDRPYRFIRHPIYAGLVVAGVGTALVRESTDVAVLTLALALVLDLKRRREEVWLLDRFPAYAAYRERTKPLVPFVY